MKFKLVDNNGVHLSDIIDKIDVIYIYDDAQNFRYSDNLDESAPSNTLPQDVIFDKSDIQKVLDDLKNCNRVFILPRPKNIGFLAKYNLTEADCKDIINQLTTKDYVKNTESRNQQYLGNNLIVFEADNIKVKGQIINNLIVYIKIDLDISTDTVAVAVSFHQTNTLDNKPY